MSVTLTINDTQVTAPEGSTILEAARAAGIEIPTLCHHPDLTNVGACRLCVVDVEGMGGLQTACTTPIADDMVVATDSEVVRATRRFTLEMLISEHCGDCFGPCEVTCPAGCNIPGFINRIAERDYREAIRIIKETIPLPLALGTVCPAPCEEECRRGEFDEAASICVLKRFAAEQDLQNGGPYLPEVAPETGYRVAIIGAGPGGLSAAYYLRQRGHEVTIYEAHEKPGGMLRYGIPSYRLPHEDLDAEIGTITALGVEIQCDTALGRDVTMDDLEEEYDAVFLAIGAQQSRMVGIPGEDSDRVWGGVEFLDSIACGEEVELGNRVVVVGGGNTAVDVARTAVRLGADEVTILYRRSREQMPALDVEVEAAAEEGVEFHFLASPVAFDDSDDQVTVTSIRMELGPPDESGRRRPIPIEGSEFTIQADAVVMAIGQAVDPSCMEESDVELTRWGTFEVDEQTLQTSVPWVFAGGDSVTGADIAVRAVAAGRRAAASIDQYLRGEEVVGIPERWGTTRGDEAPEAFFAGVEKAERQEQIELELPRRVCTFEQVECGFTEEAAVAEAARCLACACQANGMCELQDLAAEYGVPEPTSDGECQRYEIDSDPNPFVFVDRNKCILCSRCIRACEEIQNRDVWSFANRGFDTKLVAGADQPMLDARCESCGQCVAYCPTGALFDKMSVGQGWLGEAEKVRTTCAYCGVGCSFDLHVRDGEIVRVTSAEDAPVNGLSLCVKGRYGYDFIHHPDRLERPLVRARLLDDVEERVESGVWQVHDGARDGQNPVTIDPDSFIETDWDTALDLTAEKFASVKAESGPDAFAMLASAKCTNEENYLFSKFTRQLMMTNSIDHRPRLWHSATVADLATSLGSGAMTNSIRDVTEESNCIFIIGSDITEQQPVMAIMVRTAKRQRGAKLIVADPRPIDIADYADIHLQHKAGTDIALLNGLMHIIIRDGWHDEDFIAERAERFEAVKETVSAYTPERTSEITGVPVEDIEAAARLMAENRPGALLYATQTAQGTAGVENVMSYADLQVVLGNMGLRGGGVNALHAENNAQGACDMGSLPSVYAGYQDVTDPAVQNTFEQAWGVPLSTEVGLTVTEILDEAAEGQVRCLYVIGENPVTSDPGLNHVREALESTEFLVLQDLFLTETAQLADVVLPACSFAEKEGTFTNSERRVQRVRKAIEPIGESREDTWIIAQLAQRLLGLAVVDPLEEAPCAGWDYGSAADVMAEINALAPIYGGITYERLNDGEQLQWPVPSEEHPGTPILQVGRFSCGECRAA